MGLALIILIALVAVESIGRLIAAVRSDGLGRRAEADLPRTHRRYPLLNV